MESHATAPPIGVQTLSLRTNFLWTFGANVFYAACQWTMLVALAKVTDPTLVGQFSLALAITAPVYMLTNLQLRGAQATDAAKEYDFQAYLTLRFITNFVALTAIGVITLASGFSRSTCELILVIGMAKALEGISDIFWGLYQQHERMDRLARSLFIKGALGALAFLAGVAVGHSAVWAGAGLALANTLTLVLYDVGAGARILRNDSRTGAPHATWIAVASLLRPHGSPRTLWKLAWLTLPLGAVLALLSLDYGMPRYFIEHFHGSRSLGFYAATAYLMVAGSMITSALGQSASPRLAKYYAAGDIPRFNGLLKRLLVLGAAVGAAGVIISKLFGPWILTVMYEPEYARHADVLTWLVFGATLTYLAQFLGYGLTAARRFRSQLPVALTLVTSTTIGCWILVPRFQLLGAVYAVVISAAIWLGVSAVAVVYLLCRSSSNRVREQLNAAPTR